MKIFTKAKMGVYYNFHEIFQARMNKNEWNI